MKRIVITILVVGALFGGVALAHDSLVSDSMVSHIMEIRNEMDGLALDSGALALIRIFDDLSELANTWVGQFDTGLLVPEDLAMTYTMISDAASILDGYLEQYSRISGLPARFVTRINHLRRELRDFQDKKDRMLWFTQENVVHGILKDTVQLHRDLTSWRQDWIARELAQLEAELREATRLAAEELLETMSNHPVLEDEFGARANRILGIVQSDVEAAIRELASIGQDMMAFSQRYLMVMLEWLGPYDLDLEIWSEDFRYIGDAWDLGSSPDITDGNQGAEWFVFRDRFASGRYVISVYFVGPPTETSVETALTLVLPDGRGLVVEQELRYVPPYDQWFALLVDVDTQGVAVLDFFLE